MDLYSIKVERTNHELTDLSAYQGKVLLIFNSATKCGYTNQYEGIEALYEKYKEKGFEVLDFPSNQFMNQAPGSSEEVSNFCKLKFNTKFETFAKVDVNGKNQSGLFKYLKSKKPVDYGKKGLFNGLFNGKIKWNFTKFLVNQQGEVVYRFSPSFKPESIEPFMVALLNQS
ncbi:MAG: glutathione peroxidase [Acholeplasma sp.]|nr:glutathione peroxidase [Acholeplasma sp.]